MSLTVEEVEAILRLRDELTPQLNTADKSLANFGRNAAVVGAGLTATVTLPIFGVGLAAIKAGMNAEEARNLWEVSFGDMAKNADTWANTTAAGLVTTKTELKSTSATLFTMFDSMNIGKDAAFKMSTSLVDLSADMASFRNIKPEEAFEKIRAGIVGESEPLRALGILVDDNTIKQVALKHGLIGSGEEMTAQQKVMARFIAMLEQTNKDQGDLIRTQDSATNVIRQLKTDFLEMGEALGKALMPAFAEFLGIVKSAIPYFQSAVQSFGAMGPNAQLVIIGIAGLAAAIGPLLVAFGAIAGGLGSVAALFGTTAAVVASFTGIGALMIAGVASWIYVFKNLDVIVWAVKGVYEGVKTWLVDKFTALLSPIKSGVEKVSSAFTWLKDTLVGHSTVPDMVNMIHGEFDRLGGGMSEKSIAAAKKVQKVFEDAKEKWAAIWLDMSHLAQDQLKDQQDKLVKIATEGMERQQQAIIEGQALIGKVLAQYYADDVNRKLANDKAGRDEINAREVAFIEAQKARMESSGQAAREMYERMKNDGVSSAADIQQAWKAWYDKDYANRHTQLTEWNAGLSELAGSFEQLANIAGGAFGGIVKEIGTVISAMDMAAKSTATMQQGMAQFKDGQHVAGMANMATGAMGVASSFMAVTESGNTASKALKGAALGAQAGAAFGPYGVAIGAAAGALAGLVRGLFGASESLKALKAANADIAKMEDSLLQTYGSLDRIREVGGQAGQALADAWGSQNVAGLEWFKERLKDFNDEMERQARITSTLNGVLGTDQIARMNELQAVFAKLTPEQLENDKVVGRLVDLYNQLKEATGMEIEGLEDLAKGFDVSKKAADQHRKELDRGRGTMVDLTDSVAIFQQRMSNTTAITTMQTQLSALREHGQVDMGAMLSSFASLRDSIGSNNPAIAAIEAALVEFSVSGKLSFDAVSGALAALKGQFNDTFSQVQAGARATGAELERLNNLKAGREQASASGMDDQQKANAIQRFFRGNAAQHYNVDADELNSGMIAAVAEWSRVSSALGIDQGTVDRLRNSGDYNFYAKGGVVYAAGGRVIPFRPRGTDTVPAMLTPGEGVVNRRGMGLLGIGGLSRINGGDAGFMSAPDSGGGSETSIIEALRSIDRRLATLPKAVASAAAMAQR